MTKQITLLFIVFLFSCSTKNETVKPTPRIQKIITHDYTVKWTDGIPERDSLMNCFGCNQAIVYDTNGIETETRFYKKDMIKVYGTDFYLRNPEGLKTGSRYFEEGELITEYRYSYDSLKRLTQTLAYEPKSNTLLYGSVQYYDNENRPYKTANLNKDAVIQQYFIREYNENGIAIMENITDLKGNPTFRISYEYRPKADSNWVEQLVYYNDSLSVIKWRESIYYRDSI